jgi:hypothetical protein
LASLVIFLLAVGVRAALVFAVNPRLVPQRVEMDNIAISVAKGLGFANPFSTPTGPSAWYPPLYPLALALNYRWLGTESVGELGKYSLTMIGVALGYALLPSLAAAAKLPPGVGLTAAIFGALIPVHYWIEVRGNHVAWGAAFIVIQALLFSRIWSCRGRFCPSKSCACLGIASGIGALVNPTVALVLMVWLVATLIAAGVSRAVVRCTCTALLLCLAITTPWLWRNYRVFDAFVPLRSNLGLELWISNNSIAQATYYANEEAGVYRRYHPFTNIKEREQMRAMGEVAYCQSKLRLALQWIRENPGRFAALTAQRIVLFWFTPALRPLQPVILWAITVLAWVGLWRSRTRHPLVFALVGSLWIGYPLLYYFVQVDMRYRYPIYWSFLLMAAYAVVSTSAGARLCARMEMQLRRWESVVSSWQLRRRRS